MWGPVSRGVFSFLISILFCVQVLWCVACLGFRGSISCIELSYSTPLPTVTVAHTVRLSSQQLAATMLRRAEVKLDTCAQLFEAGS